MNTQADPIAIATLIFSGVTTVCALYLSYVALRHSARPKLRMRMLDPRQLTCGEEVLFRFEFSNSGHWYARPAIIDLVVFCNFPRQFSLLELRYGSDQSYTDTDVKVGVGNMMYLKAKGLKLMYGEEGEQIHVRAVAPQAQGVYRARISAFSENGVSLMREFKISCTEPESPLANQRQ